MTDIITLDSNVFKDQLFINFLMDKTEIFSKHNLPLIVYIEVLVWYEMTGLEKDDLDDDLKLIRTSIHDFPLTGINLLMNNIRNNKNLKFRHHARDFLIGTQCMLWESILLTNNKRHFEWIQDDKLMTQQEFIQKYG